MLLEETHSLCVVLLSVTTTSTSNRPLFAAPLRGILQHRRTLQTERRRRGWLRCALQRDERFACFRLWPGARSRGGCRGGTRPKLSWILQPGHSRSQFFFVHSLSQACKNFILVFLAQALQKASHVWACLCNPFQSFFLLVGVVLVLLVNLLDCLLILLPRCFTWAMSVLLVVHVVGMRKMAEHAASTEIAAWSHQNPGAWGTLSTSMSLRADGLPVLWLVVIVKQPLNGLHPGLNRLCCLRIISGCGRLPSRAGR
mmetsp:Transcript_99017/g.236284  ORF Transcript_99017/g.236284 Transcript_99017/m.236284 type:complete len:256 (+) Transcript_99017:61-828(+)